MSNQVAQFNNVRQVVAMVEPDFNKLARIHNAVNFEREASFALQILREKPSVCAAAMADQDSLKHAIINVAAIGLSLSPVHKLAYLLARGKKVCLDISYIGYVQLAVDVGSIKWAIAEVVCEKDRFQLRGRDVEPIHEFEPFGDRGEVVGAYCVAKTHDGDYLTTTMSADEIISIRSRSPAWREYEKDNTKLNPWVTDRNEMIKKTVIRRAYKSWPKTNTRQRDRMNLAIDVSNDFDASEQLPQIPAAQSDRRGEAFSKIRGMLTELNRAEEKYIAHLCTICRRDIKKLEDLTDQEISQATIMLTSLVESQRAKKAKEASVENAG